MTDAGSAFYSWNGMNRFQKLISEEYGIDQIKAGSPRSNGKVESVNKQIEKELLTVKEFSSLDDAGHGIAEWIEFYNFERTHMGLLKGEVPADRFLYGWNKSIKNLKEIREPIWEDILKIALSKLT
ncbi:MAG: integrase core domain-containing protein [Bdellovibrionales bacterium]|nr:integrase core domain-containing protein [Bdellovibrionales bacterium]